MRKGVTLFLTVFLLVSLVAMGVQAEGFNTAIAGKIYDGPNFETATGVSGATVAVTCNDVQHNTTSLADGTYSVTFGPEVGCIHTTVSAFATKGGIASPVQTASVQDYTSTLSIYLGIINIALIPEFGMGVGALTVLSAIGIFFFVRKK